MKYKKGTNGTPIPLELGDYHDDPVDKGCILIEDAELMRFACCDCAMVHTFALVLERKRPKKRQRVIVHMWSEPRRTAALRRHFYGNLQQKVVGLWKMHKVFKRNRT